MKKKDAKEKKDGMNRFIHFISLLWLIGSIQDLEAGSHYAGLKKSVTYFSAPNELSFSRIKNALNKRLSKAVEMNFKVSQ